MDNSTKTINFSAADKAVVAYLETLGEKGATLAEINKACSLNLKPSNMTTLKHKGVITTKPEKLAVETPAKRKVSLYHFARSKDDALAIAKTDTERNLIIDGDNFGLRKDGVSFTLNDATPMMMPSAVRNERNLLAAMARRAILKRLL